MDISSGLVVSVQSGGRSGTRKNRVLSRVEIAPPVASARPSVGSRKPRKALEGTIRVVVVEVRYREAPED